MDQAELPQDVVRFVAEQIDTVPHMETLLLIWENAPRSWVEAEIAARLYVAPETARSVLQDLVNRRLLVAESGSPDRYLYDSSWDPRGELMPRVAATYRRNLVRVATLIHSKASPSVRDFARAFQFKKER